MGNVYAAKSIKIRMPPRGEILEIMEAAVRRGTYPPTGGNLTVSAYASVTPVGRKPAMQLLVSPTRHTVTKAKSNK